MRRRPTASTSTWSASVPITCDQFYREYERPLSTGQNESSPTPTAKNVHLVDDEAIWNELRLQILVLPVARRGRETLVPSHKFQFAQRLEVLLPFRTSFLVVEVVEHPQVLLVHGRRVRCLRGTGLSNVISLWIHGHDHIHSDRSICVEVVS